MAARWCAIRSPPTASSRLAKRAGQGLGLARTKDPLFEGTDDMGVRGALAASAQDSLPDLVLTGQIGWAATTRGRGCRGSSGMPQVTGREDRPITDGKARSA